MSDASPEHPLRIERAKRSETTGRYARIDPDRPLEEVQREALEHVERAYKAWVEARARAQAEADRFRDHFYEDVRVALAAGVEQGTIAEMTGLSKQRLSQIKAAARRQNAQSRRRKSGKATPG